MGDFLDFLLTASLVERHRSKARAAQILENMEDDYVWGETEDYDDDDLDEFNEYENEEYYDNF